jgi:hypothetical protein
MDHSTPPSMLQRLFGRRGARRREPEPADLGTAFGMEQTLDQPDWSAPGAPAENAYPWLAGRARTGTTR